MRALIFAMLALACIAVPAHAQVAITQTQVSVPAGTDTVLIPANPYRKSLCIWNTGSGNLNLGFGTAAQSGVGVSYGPTGQAVGQCWGPADGVPVQAIHGYSATGTAIVVQEGN